MKKVLLILGTAVLLASCTSAESEKEKTVTTTPTTTDTVVKDLSGCYRMTIGKDTALLNLKAEGKIMNGSLVYDRFEKDDNKGTFKGVLEKDKIKGWYTFFAEGQTSVREIYFKVVGKNLCESYGDIALKHDTAYFKYPGAVNYEEQHPFLKTDCK